MRLEHTAFMDQWLDNSEAAFWQEPDLLLGLLVSFLANKLSAEFGITLMVRGTVLTGTLVSERTYLTLVSDLFKSLAHQAIGEPEGEVAKALEAAFDFADMAEDADDGRADGEADAVFPPIRFLHLRDPFILYPGAAMSFSESPLPILRLRLTEVDGWLPGRVHVMDRPEDEFDNGFPTHKFTQ